MISRGGDTKRVFKTVCRERLHRAGQVFRSHLRATLVSTLVKVVAGRGGVLTARYEADWVVGRLAQILTGEGTRRLLSRLNITWLLEFGKQLLGDL